MVYGFNVPIPAAVWFWLFSQGSKPEDQRIRLGTHLYNHLATPELGDLLTVKQPSQ